MQEIARSKERIFYASSIDRDHVNMLIRVPQFVIIEGGAVSDKKEVKQAANAVLAV